MYTLQGVTKQYQRGKSTVHALAGVDLTIEDGGRLVIQGPTGGGKSTLLQMLGGLDRPTAGSIELDGMDLAKLSEAKLTKVRAENIGFVFQSFNLIPTLTAQENVETALVPLGVKASERRRRAAEALGSVGLGERLGHVPGEMSGGQQQRVAIARALALDPKILLFDEPTSALDPELVNEVLDVIRELAKSGTTLIIVTHEMGFARDVADTVVFMDQGQIVEQGTPQQIFTNPQEPRTRSFFSKVLEPAFNI